MTVGSNVKLSSQLACDGNALFQMEGIDHVCSTQYRTVASELQEEIAPGCNPGLELDTDDGEQHFTLPGVTAFRRYSSLLNISEINVHLTQTKIIQFFIHSLEIFPEISLFSHKADI